ncbi:MAG: class I SAM-dependent methyltransferase [Bacteroidetes bacterium]|nr:class I SAM-dependent methyltransferase [Bacteroidota bacterium]
MKFKDIARLVHGIPYTQEERGKQIYNHVLKHKPKRCIELGFAHGVASCYIAAALDEIGSGELICVDLNSSKEIEPNLEALLEKASLQSYVSIYREENSYTWFLQKEISKNSERYNCKQIYDLCFIDGPKNWTIDGLGFFLVDKLMRNEGFIIFDDYQWKYGEYSKSVMDGISIRALSQDQINTPNIELVFQLLVMQHPNYSKFVIDEDWAWAQKKQSDVKSVRVEASQSFKYRILKKLRGFK